MKKIFRFVMAALSLAVLVSSCAKEYPFPKDEPWDTPDDPTPGEDPEYVEKTFTVDLDVIVGVETVGYSMGTVSMPKDEILSYFNMTATEFYHAMGTYDATGQINNTILFGVSDKKHESYNWTPSTSNNFGHWMTQEGAITTWGDSGSYWCLENNAEWGLDNPDDETLAAMWQFGFSFFPDRCTNQPGESIQTTHVFYLENAKPELYAYVDYVFHFVEPKEVKIDIVETKELTLDIPFASDYSNTVLPIDYDAIQATLGVPAGICSVYGVNSDGTYSLSTINDVWFSVAGDICSWGDGCGIDINNSNDEGLWQTCMFPDESLLGQTCKAAIVFANEAGKGYLVNIAVNVADKNSWSLNYEVSVGGNAAEGFLSDDDVTALAAYFGLDGEAALVDALASGAITVLPTNGDGSYYTNEDGSPKYSQYDDADGKGVFFDLDGNGTTWASGDDKFYTTVYFYEWEGEKIFEIDVVPFAAEESEVGDYRYVWAFTDGTKTATVVLNVTLVSAVPWVDYVAGDKKYEIKMTPAGGYKAYTLPVDVVATALGLTAEEYAAKYADDIEVYGYAAGARALKDDGTPKYTANGKGGCWFNADGDVDAWANGLFFIEQDGSGINVGQHGDAPAVGTESTMTFEYVLGDTSVVITYKVTIVETL